MCALDDEYRDLQSLRRQPVNGKEVIERAIYAAMES
jgi:hypothetical protein